MGVKARLRGIAPWSGLIASGLAFALAHQVITDALHFDCTRTADGPGMAWAVLALALLGLGAWLSLRARPPVDAASATASVRRFAANLGLLAAMLAALGLAFFLIALSILPGCRP
jgi:hypothetical protein